MTGSANNKDTIHEECDEFIFEEEIEEYGYYLILGRRRSGKTTYMRHISQHLPVSFTAQHIVIAGAENIKEAWSELVHAYYIHDPTPTILDTIIDEQNRRVKECRLAGIPFPKEWEVVLWIDDCGTYREFMQSKQMRKISSNGRQYKMYVFTSIQKLKHAHTECRENPDAIFTLNTQHAPTITTLRTEFASSVPVPIFHAALIGATREKGMCIIRGHPKTPTSKDIFAFTHYDLLHPDGWKGELRRLGDASHWEEAERNYKKPVSGLSTLAGKQNPPKLADDSDSEEKEDVTSTASANSNVSKVPQVFHLNDKPFTAGNVTFAYKSRTVKQSKTPHENQVVTAH